MKRAELHELHQQSLEHLQGLLEEKQEHLLKKVRMRAAAGQGVNPHEAREVRRDIARIKTLIREKKLGIDRPSAARSSAAAQPSGAPESKPEPKLEPELEKEEAS